MTRIRRGASDVAIGKVRFKFILEKVQVSNIMRQCVPESRS